MKFSFCFTLLSPVLSILAFAQQREFNFYIEKKDSTISLHLTSLETFPCWGYMIRTFQLWDHDTLIVEIRGFIRPTPCYRNVDVARMSQRMMGVRSKQFAVKLRWKEKIDLWLIDTSKGILTAKEKQVTFTSWFRD